MTLTLFAWLVPGFDVAYGSSDMHVALEMTASSVGVVVGFMALARYRQTQRLGDLSLAVAVGFVLPVASALLLALPTMLNYGQVRPFSVWSSLIAQVGAAGLLVVGGVGSGRVVRVAPGRVAGASYAAAAAFLALTAGILQHIGAALPVGVDPALSPVGAGRAAFVGDSWLLAGEATSAVLLAVAALGFLRGIGSDTGPLAVWSVPALTTASLATSNYILFPSAYSYWVYSGDVLSLAVLLLFTWGVLGEVRAHTQTLVATAVLEERRRLARELHDGVAQELAFIRSGLREVPEELVPQLAWVRSAAERALYESRRAIVALTAPLDQPLATALAEALGDVADRSGVKLVVDAEEPSTLAGARREVLVRVAREAVVNAIRHGQPNNVTVSIRNRNGLTLDIRDDGRGFDPSMTSGASFGLTTMRERVERDGGKFSVESAPDAGTTIRARWTQP